MTIPCKARNRLLALGALALALASIAMPASPAWGQAAPQGRPRLFHSKPPLTASRQQPPMELSGSYRPGSMVKHAPTDRGLPALPTSWTSMPM